MFRLICLAGTILSWPIGAFAQLQPTAETTPPRLEMPGALIAVDGAIFIQRAFQASLQEIAISRVVLGRDVDEDVKNLAARILVRHKRFLNEIAEIAEASDLPLEPDDREMQKALKNVSRLDDRRYIEGGIKAHGAIIRLYTAYAESGDITALRDYAVAMLPMLQEDHQALAKLAKNLTRKPQPNPAHARP